MSSPRPAGPPTCPLLTRQPGSVSPEQAHSLQTSRVCPGFFLPPALQALTSLLSGIFCHSKGQIYTPASSVLKVTANWALM